MMIHKKCHYSRRKPQDVREQFRESLLRKLGTSPEHVKQAV